MLEIIVGLVSGVLCGLGVGGGTLLILILSVFLGVNQKIAQGTNLIFFIPTSLVSIIVNIKEKNTNVKLAVLLSLFGVIGALVGAYISKNINVEVLRKIFAFFLLIIAIYEIYSLYKEYIKLKNTHTK